MKRSAKGTWKGVFSLRRFFLFFGLATFAVTCCMLLFLYGMDDPKALARERAAITFLNVIFISILLTAVDMLYRYFTVQAPLRRVLEATGRMRQGDFSARVGQFSNPAISPEIGIIAEDIDRLAEELQGVETLRTDFIANVSHEMKTPLAVIRNYCALLQSPDLSEAERLEYTGILTGEADRLSDLITNILRLNKLENQQIYPNVRRFDLGEQLCACLLGFETVWEKKEIGIETDIAPDLFICADAELLEIVWNNLLSNAMKFTDRGGKVRVCAQKTDGVYTVTVADTGCGISAEAGKHIFEKFYQGDKSHATQGNGLGLALVKRIIDIMYGDISVQSEVGQGTVFTVRLGEFQSDETAKDRS